MTKLFLFLTLATGLPSCTTPATRQPAAISFDDEKEFVRQHMQDVVLFPQVSEYNKEQLLWDAQYFKADSPEFEHLKQLTKDYYAKDPAHLKRIEFLGGATTEMNWRDARMVIAAMRAYVRLGKVVGLKENKGNWEFEMVDRATYTPPAALVRKNMAMITTRMIYGSETERRDLAGMPFQLIRAGYVYDSRSNEFYPRSEAGCAITTRFGKEWMDYRYSSRMDSKTTCKGENSNRLYSEYVAVLDASPVCPAFDEKLADFEKHADEFLMCSRREQWTAGCETSRTQMVDRLTRISYNNDDVFKHYKNGCGGVTQADFIASIQPLKDLQIQQSQSLLSCDPALAAMLKAAHDKIDKFEYCIGRLWMNYFKD